MAKGLVLVGIMNLVYQVTCGHLFRGFCDFMDESPLY